MRAAYRNQPSLEHFFASSTDVILASHRCILVAKKAIQPLARLQTSSW
jgi:hypothetical protein